MNVAARIFIARIGVSFRETAEFWRHCSGLCREPTQFSEINYHVAQGNCRPRQHIDFGLSPWQLKLGQRISSTAADNMNESRIGPFSLEEKLGGKESSV